MKDKLSWERFLSRWRGLCTHSLKRANSEMEVITLKITTIKRLKIKLARIYLKVENKICFSYTVIGVSIWWTR